MSNAFHKFGDDLWQFFIYNSYILNVVNVTTLSRDLFPVIYSFYTVQSFIASKLQENLAIKKAENVMVVVG